MPTLDFTPRRYHDFDADKRPSLAEALVPVMALILSLSVGRILLNLHSTIPLLWGIVFAGLMGRYYFGYTWNDLYDGIGQSILMGLQAVLILLVIHMLIAAWTGAGTIPTLMYYGLEFLSPKIFLPFAAILGLLVAFAVGSSWTAAATLGVAMIGIGEGLGIPAPMTAGAVLSGAYAGDKNSPLSDTSNLSAAVTNTELMTHVRTMRAGTVVAFSISLAAFVYLGLSAGGAIPTGRVVEMQSVLNGLYAITPLTLLPLFVTFALALRGYPALPSLSAGVFAGVGVSVFVQGVGFAAAWDALWAGTAPPTITSSLAPAVEQVLEEQLLTTAGVQGSMGVIAIVVAALTLGGVLESTGVLATLAHYVGRAVRSVFGLTAGTVASTVSMNFLAADQYVAIVVPGMTLRNLYDEYDLESRNLSRALQASGTTTSAFVPWGSGGVFMATTLGVPVVQYAPFYVFGLLNPLVLLVMGATGWKIFYRDTDDAGDVERLPSVPQAD